MNGKLILKEGEIQHVYLKYDWKDVRENYRILKRYDLSIKDLTILENSRGIPVIVYPPSEIMKGMKMYPPYEQK